MADDLELSIFTLAGEHRGEDIYVIGSGPSAGYVDLSFLANKVTIGVNWAHLRFPVTYTLCKENGVARSAYEAGQTLIASRYSGGNTQGQLNRFSGCGPYYVFEHRHNTCAIDGLDEISGKVLVGYSTITSAMHVAAIFGAANIILIGHDCGTLDGQCNYPGYPTAPLGSEFYRDFIRKIEDQTIIVRAWLKREYGVNVYSLNPFIGLGLEGHEYRR